MSDIDERIKSLKAIIKIRRIELLALKVWIVFFYVWVAVMVTFSAWALFDNLTSL